MITLVGSAPEVECVILMVAGTGTTGCYMHGNRNGTKLQFRPLGSQPHGTQLQGSQSQGIQPQGTQSQETQPQVNQPQPTQPQLRRGST